MVMTPAAETVGDRIARLRRKLGMNQAELAARAGCRPNQVSKYERGTYDPKLPVLSGLATALGISIDYLVTGKETSPEPDRLLALWPVLGRLPLGLRNEIAGFLTSVIYAQSLFGLSEAVPQQRGASSAGKPSLGPRRHWKGRS